MKTENIYYPNIEEPDSLNMLETVQNIELQEHKNAYRVPLNVPEYRTKQNNARREIEDRRHEAQNIDLW